MIVSSEGGRLGWVGWEGGREGGRVGGWVSMHGSGIGSSGPRYPLAVASLSSRFGFIAWFPQLLACFPCAHSYHPSEQGGAEGGREEGRCVWTTYLPAARSESRFLMK